MKPLPAFVLSISLAVSALAAEKGEKKSEGKPDTAKLEEQTRLQIFLDRANFGPGKIDGRDGEFTRKALQLYQQAQSGAQGQGVQAGQAAAGKSGETESRKEDKASSASQKAGIDLSGIDPVFVKYTVSKDDAANVGEIPEDHAAQAKLKSMPYRTVLEAVAERFHSDIDFLKELNPGVKAEGLKEGDTLTVPNVEPFDVAAVKQIKPGEALDETETVSDTEDNEAAGEKGKTAEKKEGADAKSEKAGGKEKSERADARDGDKKGEESGAAASVALQISVHDKMLVVYEGKQIKAAFPITPGSTAIPSPVGQWKVERVAKMPNFRWDEKMLKQGERSANAHLLPPGPNNPVGVMWIALNKKGIGIHGTDDPDTIGRAASHGCIRLANWDVVKLAKLVKPGVPVTIQ